jgi:hypothetical protein
MQTIMEALTRAVDVFLRRTVAYLRIFGDGKGETTARFSF